ncbi:hypothetical protein [Superficieibacter electus]|uniref:hypothetical protein n=1 Tax=Superficieibacter electus TaxID=2022662 RepID=UPI0011132721|nr:hypothetical protein [Superficieibacter electus]
MKTGKYWLLNILTLMLGIPVIASIVILIVKVLFNCDLRDAAGVTVSAVATACGGAVMASIWGGRRLPETFFARYSPVLLALFCTLALWFSLLIMTDGDFENDLFFDVSHNIFFISYFITFFPFSADCDEIEPLQVLVLLIPTVACFSFAVTLAALSRRQGVQIRGRRGQRAALVVTGGLMLAVAALLGWQTYDRHYRLVEETDKYTLRANIDIWDYMPFWEGNRLTQLASPPTLHIGRDWPRLDGATALYPLYASAVQAIYQNQDETSIRELVDSHRTPLAYDSLIKGNVDMIFALEPSA